MNKNDQQGGTHQQHTQAGQQTSMNRNDQSSTSEEDTKNTMQENSSDDQSQDNSGKFTNRPEEDVQESAHKGGQH